MTAQGDRRLEAAVTLGIITEQQAAEIRALAAEPARSASGESPRAFNAATLAYILGAITVVIAMGWFLADRWDWLGAGGVLAMSVLYAALFVLVGTRLRRAGFSTAAGFAVLLAVFMAPVATVAWNELVGWFESAPGPTCRYPDFVLWTCRGEEMLAELVTVAAALVSLRRVRFSLLVLPPAAIAIRFLFHLSDLLGRDGFGDASAGWVWVLGASALVAAAYTTDRAQEGDEDYGLWLHLAAAACALAATVQLLNVFEELRHFLIPGAFVAFAAALTMRRFIWLVLGMVWFIWYLVWLASDVFKDSPLFPVILAALGIGTIGATVWVQKNASALVQRFGTVTSDGRPRFPGGVPLLLSPALVAALLMPQALELDLEQRRAREWQQRRMQLQAERETARAAQRGSADSAGTTPPAGAPSGETVPSRRP